MKKIVDNRNRLRVDLENKNIDIDFVFFRRV